MAFQYLNIWPCMYATTGCFFFSSNVVARDFVHIECYVGRCVYSTSVISPMYSEHLAKLDQHLDDSLVHGHAPLSFINPAGYARIVGVNDWQEHQQ